VPKRPAAVDRQTTLAMLVDSYKYFTSGAWWVFCFLGAAIMLPVLGFNLLGDGLRAALDPRLGGG
jgi:peptide/nickel transport system permease protein